MEAVGQLTGGIAHDFNNLLTVILSTAELIDAELPPHATEARTDLTDLKHAAERGAEMIRKLLAFSRSGQLQFRSYDLSRARDRISADAAPGAPLACRGAGGRRSHRPTR